MTTEQWAYVLIFATALFMFLRVALTPAADYLLDTFPCPGCGNAIEVRRGQGLTIQVFHRGIECRSYGTVTFEHKLKKQVMERLASLAASARNERKDKT